MGLTTEDLSQIKVSISDVVSPRFDEMNMRFDETNIRFGQLKSELDGLASATNRKFHTVFTDIAVTREDLKVMKQMVREHGYRLAQLEAPQE